ncbi:MAG: cupin domain-containing protein [Vicinamibacterales bacterium]
MSISRVRLMMAGAISVAGLATISIVQAQQPVPADDPRFTGVSTVLDAKDVSAGRRRFEPGARSAWHSHDNGQLLYVQEGRMRAQKRGQAMKEFGPGESDYTGPRIEHWHGAAPHTHLIQINIGFGGETRWLQKTTEEEYSGKK